MDHSKIEHADTDGNHINGLEGFWGYLKRKMEVKGGSRKEHLYLYLREYVWQYNHNKSSSQRARKTFIKNHSCCKFYQENSRDFILISIIYNINFLQYIFLFFKSQGFNSDRIDSY